MVSCKLCGKTKGGVRCFCKGAQLSAVDHALEQALALADARLAELKEMGDDRGIGHAYYTGYRQAVQTIAESRRTK